MEKMGHNAIAARSDSRQRRKLTSRLFTLPWRPSCPSFNASWKAQLSTLIKYLILQSVNFWCTYYKNNWKAKFFVKTVDQYMGSVDVVKWIRGIAILPMAYSVIKFRIRCSPLLSVAVCCDPLQSVVCPFRYFGGPRRTAIATQNWWLGDNEAIVDKC